MQLSLYTEGRGKELRREKLASFSDIGYRTESDLYLEILMIRLEYQG